MGGSPARSTWASSPSLAARVGGLVLEKTQLFLQDVGSAPTTLSSSGLEGIAEVVIGGRWRPWKGLTMRLEVDVLLRQGALEPVFLLGAGWVF
jgi:hypothetical protein